MGSNGSMRFVAWVDGRRRDLSFGTRVALDGTPLDPQGIVIPDITSPEAVVWTGAEFAVIGRTTNGRGVVFVGTDATVSDFKPVDVPPLYSLQAISAPASDTRLLFVRSDSNTTLYARIVSARGDVLATVATPLAAALFASPRGSGLISAGRRDDFTIFSPSAVVRIDRDGHVLTNRAVSWPFQNLSEGTSAVAGIDGQGFVLLKQDPLNESAPTVLACQLDDNGALTGKRAYLPLPYFWKLTQFRPVIVPSGQGYLVVNEGIYGDNRPHQYLTDLAFDLTARTREVPDAGLPLLLGVEGGDALVVASKGAALYLQPLSASGATAAPILLNLAPPTQIEVAVTATPNGYAVAWLEQKAALSWQTYIRRFSIAGEPLDAAPLEVSPPVDNLSISSPVLTATADVYFINGRRLDASTGQWIDDAPIPRLVAAASNGREVLLAVMGTGASLQQLSPMGGKPAPPVPLPSSAAGPVAISQNSSARITLASDGTDYLVVWNRYNCCFTLGTPTSPVFALRIRADGTWIDAAPMQVSPDGWQPSVAWAGGSYVVTWAGPGGLHVTRVGTSGNALDGTGDGVIVEVPAPYEELSASVVSLGRDAMLLVRRRTSEGTIVWTAVRFDPRDLPSVATAVRTPLASDYSAAATSLGGRLLLAYSTNLGATTGFAWRAYVQEFADPIYRRRSIAQ